MDREQVLQKVISSRSQNLLLELPTSYGKTKMALEWVKNRVSKGKILIVIPRLVLVENWRQEIKKWGQEDIMDKTDFVTYVSFPKVIGERNYDAIIFDEAHHLSDRCKDALDICKINKASNKIFLSATVNKDMKEYLRNTHNVQVIKELVKNAIDDGVLPEPMVILIPMHLDNKIVDQEIIRNKNMKDAIAVDYANRFKYNSVKNKKIVIRCTQQQYYDEQSRLIDYYKNRKSQPFMKIKWLQAAGVRLKWLSSLKTEFCKEILKQIEDKRSLTFCNSINQANLLGKNNINSKNKKSEEVLHAFNCGEINHITAVDMLNEGQNLSECQIGLYASLHSSDRLILQQAGRILRHKNPIFIIPFYRYTRDEEIVRVMIQNYDKSLIKKAKTIEDIIKLINNQ